MHVLPGRSGQEKILLTQQDDRLCLEFLLPNNGWCPSLCFQAPEISAMALRCTPYTGAEKQKPKTPSMFCVPVEADLEQRFKYRPFERHRKPPSESGDRTAKGSQPRKAVTVAGPATVLSNKRFRTLPPFSSRDRSRQDGQLLTPGRALPRLQTERPPGASEKSLRWLTDSGDWNATFRPESGALAQAALTIYYGLGGLNNGNVFSWFWRVGQGAHVVGLWWRPAFHVYLHHWVRGRGGGVGEGEMEGERENTLSGVSF